jgi:hypothetical protein
MSRFRIATIRLASVVLTVASLSYPVRADNYIQTYEMPYYPSTGSSYSPTITETLFSGHANQSTAWTSTGAELRSDLTFDQSGFTFSGRAYSDYIPRGIALHLDFTVNEDTPIQISLPYFMRGAAGLSLGRVARTSFALSQNGGTLLSQYQFGSNGYAAGGGSLPAGWTSTSIGGDWTKDPTGLYLFAGELGAGTYSIDIDVLRTDGNPPSNYWYNDFSFQVLLNADPIPAPSAAPLLALAGLTARGRRRK